MNVSEFRKYSLVECQVKRHQHYGLVVRTVLDDQPGFVDESAISDAPYTAADDWPPVGETLVCVVLGDTRDGRLRLSSRPRDIALVRAVTDVEAALSAWRRVRDEPSEDANRLAEFFGSRIAVPTLRWALNRPIGSVDRARASEIVVKAPYSLGRELHN